MKVLFACNLFPRKRGAFEDFVIGVGDGLCKNADELVCVFSDEPCESVAGGLQKSAVRWHVVAGWADAESACVYPWAIVFPLLRIIREEQPDLVALHFGNELPSIVLILLAKICVRKSVKWVWHQRQQIMDPAGMACWLSRIRVAACFFDHIVVSYQGGFHSLRLRHVPARKVSVIHNALRQPILDAGRYVRKLLGIADEAVVFANVGWFVPRKRIHLALQAFAEVSRRSAAECYLLLVGDGPEESALKQMAGELGISGNVRFLGFREDVCAILAETDVLVHTADAETCTNVVQEAMVVGCPVVMMNAGAAREQVVDGITGFVVERDSTEDLLLRLCEIAGNRELRIRMGEAAKQRWDAFFKLSLSVRKHCILYRSLCSVMDEQPDCER